MTIARGNIADTHHKMFAGPQDTRDFCDHRLGLRHVFKHLRYDNCIERSIVKVQAST